MDMRSWKKVLLQWITECGFMERNYFNIEQSDIDVFYQNFSLQHPKTASGKYKRLNDFLKEFYAHFEAHQDDENCLSSSDYVYIYSMLLHFCCVKYPESIFHEICQRLPEHTQQCIASFFKELLDTAAITKEALRHAISYVVTMHVTPPRLNESFTSNQSVSAISVGGMGGGGAGSISNCSLPSPSFSRCDSPLKTPKRSAGPQRVSPTTPKSYLLEERTRELYNLRAQLETERYEKGLLEVQIKQNEDKILKLNYDHKKLLHQIQDLKNDILLKTSDGSGSTNRDGDDQIHKRLLKEMTLKENEIIKLNDIVRTLREEKVLVQEKLSYAEKQIVLCMNRIRELDFKVDELSDEIEKKNGTIKYLTDSKLELEQFITENRSTNMHTDLNGSMECFDSSFARNIANNNASSNVSSPENLGASVIDVQLREKEHENSKLKEELESFKDEHKRLAKSLQDLAEKQAKEFDIVIEHHSAYMEESEQDDSVHSSEALEQFSIFSSCMEKISSHHKTEKNRVKELEEANEDLTLKLDTLSGEITVLKESVNGVEKKNEQLINDLESTREQLEVSQKANVELRQNNALLQQQADELQSKHEGLRENNTLLQQQSDELQSKHENLQEQLSLKANEFDDQIKNLLEKLALQSEEIKAHQTAEQAMKNNYEQLVIENEQLKEKARDADNHLSDMQRDLLEKQTEIAKLAVEIADFTQKNKQLEDKIDAIVQECQQEQLTHEGLETNRQQEIKALQEEIKSLQADKQAEITKLGQEIANLSQTNEELEEKIEAAVQECQQEKLIQIKRLEEIKSLENEVNRLQLALEETKGDVSNKAQENEEMKQLLAELKTSRQQEIKALEDDINRLQVEKQAEITKLTQEIADLSQKNKELEVKIETAMQECQQEQLTQINRQHEIKALEDQINSLQLALEETKGELSNKAQEVEETQQLMAELTNKRQLELQALEDQINKLQLALEETKDDLVNKSQQNEEMNELLAELTPKVSDILILCGFANISESCLQNAISLEQQVTHLMQQNNETNAQLDTLKSLQLESSNRIEHLQQELAEKNKNLIQSAESNEEVVLMLRNQNSGYEGQIEKLQEDLVSLRSQNNEYEDKMEKLKEKQSQFIEKVKRDLSKKEEELSAKMKQASHEYEASLERIRVELQLEKEHHNTKEQELLLVIAQHNDVKKQLNEKESEVEQLSQANAALQEQNKKLKLFESRVSECSHENQQLQQEIESFKQEVHHNAMRLLEADKAITELFEITKEQEHNKTHILKLQEILNEKENALESQLEVQQDLERQLEEQCEAISNLSETLKKFEQHKEVLDQQIHREQEEKALLLSSLEKSADQLKSLEDEKNRQTASMEQKYTDIKQQLDELTLQNTKLQGDLVEREAELRMSLEDHEQERENFEQKLAQVKQQVTESSEHLESFDMALVEILAILENNFNLNREMQQAEVKNLFNVPATTNNKETKLNQLRTNLNIVLHLDTQLQSKLKELTVKRDEALSSLETAQKTNAMLQAKITQQDKDLKELKEQVENEELIVEKRVSQEIRRLEEDLLNLEKVNERLANGNFEMQETMSNLEKDHKNVQGKLDKLEEEKLTLKEEICTKSKVLEKLQQEEKRLQQTIKEKSQQLEKASEKFKLLECQHKEKSTKLQTLTKEHQDLKDTSQKQQQKIDQQAEQLQTLQADQAKLNEKLKQLQTTNDALETEVASKTKELLSLNNKSTELLESLKNIEQQLQLTTEKLDESEALKLNSETNCQQIQSDTQQLQRDMDFMKAQQQSALEEHQRLAKEIESLKQDKLHLREEIRDTKSDLQRANDNVTQLIQQISSIRLEKEAVVEENVLLRKQLEESGKHHSSSETKLKSIVEKSQDFERKLLTAENELKSAKANLEKSEMNVQKLSAENTKLKDSQETATKRIEKLALKLGDSQARSTKLERDNEKLGKTLEANATTVEALQKEKDLLQNEAKALKERVSRAERAHEQLAAKVQNLEHLNAQLQETKQKLEASEIDGKSKLNKLEKMRVSNEEKIRKLANSLNNAEHATVKLNLEIGSLNSQLQEARSLNTQEQVQDLTHKLEAVQQECARYEELSEKLQLEVDNLREDKTTLSDQLSKVSLTLQITKEHCEKLCSEMEQIRADLLVIRDEKSRAEIQHETSSLKLKDLETQNDHLLHERKNLVTSLETRIACLEEQLAAKCKEVDDLQQEIQTLRESSESNSSLVQQSVTASQSEMEQLRAKMSLADEALQKEQDVISQLRLDNQILHTKYQESKQRALDANKNSEERIKENRLELEGKLEKMKNKMKTLYTEEITKMKTKQEREVVHIKSEMEVLKAQNSKYEEHTRKLSNQIVRLNDNILEYQKENAILSTKLKHLLEHHETEKFKRPNSIHVSTISSSTGPSGSSNIGTNLAMEDEEGEVFNNTYLTDLKTGQMSEYMSREVCAEELKYRNSLLPPHLRSTYAAQFDNEIAEDELKDGPHSFDDSMSALLSTTAGGTRKKCGGVTHYKRPGPPTPSKNGRLSFGGGGASEAMREILKESFEGNATGAVSSSSKTPARFNFFTSRFSMGTGKDEKPYIKPDTEERKLIKAIQNKPPAKAINRRLLGGAVCTSTPRKSKVHYDQRRLLDQLLTSSPSPSPLTMEHKNVKLEKKITPPDVSFIETPLTVLDKYVPPKAPQRKQNVVKRIEAIAAGLKNKRRNSFIYGRRLSRRLEEICTPTSGDTTSSAAFSNTPKDKVRRKTISSVTTTTSGGLKGNTVILQKRLKKKPQKERNARPSLYLRGNIFAKYRRTPSRGAQHDLNKCKSRKQRLDQFNRGRDLKAAEDETMIKNLTYDITNNNYATFNHNKLGETMVIVKEKQLEDEEEEEEESFRCASEVFQTHDTSEEWQAYDHDYVCDYDDTEEDSSVGDEGEDEDEKKDIKYDIYKQQQEDICKQELITSLDLEAFDRYVSGVTKAKQEPPDEYEHYSSRGSSQHFEKLVREKQSNAPFKVKHIDFNISSGNSNSSQQHSRHSFKFSSTHHATGQSTDLPDNQGVKEATPHLSPSSTPGNLSRIIYGGTVIYNRRLPNINTTYVRKSSIYVKNNNNSTTCNDIVLITNQTITVADLARMWKQMNNSARLIVSLAALASFITLLGLFLSFYSKH